MMNKQGVYLITGGTSGVGKAMATDSAAAGHPVIVLSRDRQRADFTAKLIRKQTKNQQVNGYAIDLESEESILKLVEQLKERSVKISILAHNAALLLFSGSDRKVRMLRANVIGPLKLTQELVKEGLLEKDGRIMVSAGAPNVFKLAGKTPDEFLSAHNLSLFSVYLHTILYRVLGFMDFADQVKNRPVYIFHPGGVKTNLLAHGPWYFKVLLKLMNPVLSNHSPTGNVLALSVPAAVSGSFFSNRRKVAFHHRLKGKVTVGNLMTLMELKEKAS